jgi:hypothetical protein
MSPYNAKRRSSKQLQRNVEEWVEKKYRDPQKAELRRRLWKGDWQFGLIVGKVRHPEELSLIKGYGIRVVEIASILKEIKPKWSARGTTFIVGAAAGADLVDLMFAHAQLTKSASPERSGWKASPDPVRPAR